jgi:uncharacterized protein YbjQ (UPF0145 family)
MLTMTIETPPKGKVIAEVFSMLEIGYTVRLTPKGWFEKTFDSEVKNRGEALADFISNAPDRANAIMGMRLTLATQSFSDGNLMYIIYSGTPVRLEDAEVMPVRPNY